MVHLFFHQARFKRSTNHPSGFTLVEVLIAGSLLLMVMMSVARISIQSITSGRHRIERDRIEAAIHNNIQLIQQATARLTLDAIPNQEQQRACLDPAEYLKQQLESPAGDMAVPAPLVKGMDGSNPITRSIETGAIPGIAVITYLFSAPDHSIDDERRIVELNPNFQTRCIL